MLLIDWVPCPQADDDEEVEEQQQQRQGTWAGQMACSVGLPGAMPAGFVMHQMGGPVAMGAAGGPQAMAGMAMAQMPQDPQQAGMFMAAMQANSGM